MKKSKPTSSDVCKALEKYFKTPIFFNKETGEFEMYYTVNDEKHTILITENNDESPLYDFYSFCIHGYLTPDLLILVGKFYKGWLDEMVR